MAEMALKDGNAFSNPRKGNEQEIAAIFRRILTVNEGAVMSLSPPRTPVLRSARAPCRRHQ